MGLMPRYPEKLKANNALHQGKGLGVIQTILRRIFLQHRKVCETNARSLMTWLSYQPNYATQCRKILHSRTQERTLCWIYHRTSGYRTSTEESWQSDRIGNKACSKVKKI